MPITLTCLHCNKTFSVPPSVASKKFCSKACFTAHHRVQKTCVICGKTFTVNSYNAEVLQTCRSEACKKEVHRQRMLGTTLSEQAKAKIGKANRKEWMEVECVCGCGEKFELPGYRIKRSKTNIFFVDPTHMHKWIVGENHWNYRGGRVFYGDSWTKVAQAVRERDKVCQMCGKTPEENGRGLDVHHKDPARVSRDNGMDNLVALCMSCHHRINVFEQYRYPHKVTQYRRCIVCDKIFIPEPFQRFCSSECRRKRERQYEKKYRDSHPDYVQRRNQHIKAWQQAHPGYNRRRP